MKNKARRLDLVAELYQSVRFIDVGEFKEIIATQKIRVIDLNDAPLLNWAILKQDAQMARLLLRCKADPNIKDYKNKAPIHYAIQQDNQQLVEILIGGRDKLIQDDGNIKIDLEIEDNLGRTPLHYAVKRQDIKIASLLIQSSVNLDHQDKLGATPLSLAIHLQKADMVEILLNNGANNNTINVSHDPKKPMLYALEKVYAYLKNLVRPYCININSDADNERDLADMKEAIHNHVVIIQLLADKNYTADESSEIQNISNSSHQCKNPINEIVKKIYIEINMINHQYDENDEFSDYLSSECKKLLDIIQNHSPEGEGLIFLGGECNFTEE